MRRRRRGVAVLFVVVAILAGLAVFVALRMLTMKAELNVEMYYENPMATRPQIEIAKGDEEWAIALNSKTIGKSSDELTVRPTASTAKMIMALAVMEKKPFVLGENGETITITDEMYNNYTSYIARNGSTTAVAVGEEISEYDALSAALIASSNNMADTLAIWAFSSMEDYREYATLMLERMGARSTVIGEDASGYEASTVSTAEDLALIGEAVLKQPVLAEIVGKTEAVIPVAGRIVNTNKLLGVDGIIGVKTGYIGDISGYCLVSGYKVGDETMTVALLGAATRQGSFDETEEIVGDLQKSVVLQKLVERNEEVGYVYTWWTGRVPIKATDELQGVIVSDVQAELKMDDLDKKVNERDGVLSGALTVTTTETEYVTEVKTEEFAGKPTIWQRFLHVFGWEADQAV